MIVDNNKPIGVIVAGGDNYIGRNLIAQLLNQSPPPTVFCYLNSSKYAQYDELDFLSGIHNLLSKDAQTAGIIEKMKHVIPVYGVIGEPYLGLANSIYMFKDYCIDQIWHAGHFNNQYDLYRDKIYGLNLGLTEGLIELARVIGIKEFYYFSSAFQPNNRINYPGLDSKIMSDKLLLDVKNLENIKLCIFRPTIVVDDSGSYECNLSNYLEQLHWFLGFVSDRQNEYFTYQPLSILANSATELNFIPVSSMIKQSIEISKTDHSSECYLANSSPIQLEEFITILSHVFTDLNIKIDKFENYNPLDELLYNKTRYYMDFISAHTFVPNNIEQLVCFDFNSDKIADFISGFGGDFEEEKRLWDEKSTDMIVQMQKKVIKCPNNSLLEYYSIGSGPEIIVSGALGPNIYMWKWIINRLSKNHRIILWETRGLKYDHYQNESANFIYGYDARANDIKLVMDAEKLDKSHILAWCSGTKDALSFTRENPDKVRSLIFVAGNYTHEVDQDTAFGKNIKEMSGVLARESKVANLFVKVLGSPPKIKVNDPSHDEINSIIGQINPRYIRMVREGVFNSEGLLLYCKRYALDTSFECSEYVHSIQIPTLVISGQNDSICKPVQSDWFFNNVTSAKFVQFNAATHYIPVENWQELCEATEYFLEDLLMR